jgi:hypothetical protein
MKKALLALVLVAAVAALAGGFSSQARAYGGDGKMGVYQVGFSFNCDKASASASPACGGADGGFGGFWGWFEFDSSTNNPNAGYGGDGQTTGCSHGGGFSGAGHSVYDITDWYIQVDPSMGIPTFYASWTETDTFRGQSQTFQVIDQSTGIPAFTIHRKVLQLFGIPTPAGASLNVQVSWKPAH